MFFFALARFQVSGPSRTPAISCRPAGPWGIFTRGDAYRGFRPRLLLFDASGVGGEFRVGDNAVLRRFMRPALTLLARHTGGVTSHWGYYGG